MKNYIISGIQQVGIGVPNVHDAWKWYRENFGMDVKVFEEEATANYMLPYTGGVPQKRHAVLALNIQGGGGFEIWQYKDRIPQAPKERPMLGDLGIFAARMKSKNIRITRERMMGSRQCVSDIFRDPLGNEWFYVVDPGNNIFQFIESKKWFSEDHKDNGGPAGAMIGVSDIDKAMEVYSGILGYDKVVFDVRGSQPDFVTLNGGDKQFRRVLLSHSQERKGPFSRLFGDSQIELIQCLDRKPAKIFEGRFWGDLGFIHLCYDIRGFEELQKYCESKGFPYTVNSKEKLNGIFDMGEAAGHFAYIEDPDGTLIEFVETHKVPILKKLGWYLNLQKRDSEKALPDWMLRAMRFSKVK